MFRHLKPLGWGWGKSLVMVTFLRKPTDSQYDIGHEPRKLVSEANVLHSHLHPQLPNCHPVICNIEWSNMNVNPQKNDQPPLPKHTSHNTFLNNWYLVVECTHMQGGVSRCILGAHVSSVEQQVFQVLHVTIATCLKGQIHTFTLFTKYTVFYLQSQKGETAQCLWEKNVQ